MKHGKHPGEIFPESIALTIADKSQSYVLSVALARTSLTLTRKLKGIIVTVSRWLKLPHFKRDLKMEKTQEVITVKA